MGLDINILSVDIKKSRGAWMLARSLGDDDSARKHFQKFYESAFQAYRECLQQLNRVHKEIKNSNNLSLIEDLVGFRYELRRLADEYGSCLQKLGDFDGVEFLNLN